MSVICLNLYTFIYTIIFTLIYTSGVSIILQKCLIAANFTLIGSHFPTTLHWAINDVTALVGLFSGIWR